MKVSIYTVYKDYHWFLDKCIQGVMSNLISGTEYIFVDYGSAKVDYIDPLLDVTPHDQIKFYRMGNSDKNITFIEAVQFAVSRCTGEYIIRADADDFFYPKAVSEMLSFIQANPEYSAVIPNHDIVNGSGRITRSNRKGDSIDFPLPSCALINRHAFRKIEFMKDQEIRDKLNLIYTFEKEGFKIYYLDRPLFGYRDHTKSISHGGIDSDVVDAAEDNIKRHFGKADDTRKPNH